jgi:hypothetical protein
LFKRDILSSQKTMFVYRKYYIYNDLMHGRIHFLKCNIKLKVSKTSMLAHKYIKNALDYKKCVCVHRDYLIT